MGFARHFFFKDLLKVGFMKKLCIPTLAAEFWLLQWVKETVIDK